MNVLFRMVRNNLQQAKAAVSNTAEINRWRNGLRLLGTATAVTAGSVFALTSSAQDGLGYGDIGQSPFFLSVQQDAAPLPTVASADASPCAGVGHTLSERQKAQFSVAIGQHLTRKLGKTLEKIISLTSKDILQEYHVGSWYIFYVDDHYTDEPYLFYNLASTRSATYITAWAGGAATSEEPAILSWVRANAPGIPDQLARCFASIVTHGLSL